MGKVTDSLRGDPEISAVKRVMTQADPRGLRIAHAIRSGLDLLFDGQHTGRYAWGQLNRSETSYANGAMDIAIQREFGLPDGVVSTYVIADVELRACFTVEFGDWKIHDAKANSAHVLLWANDVVGKCGFGLLRIRNTRHRQDAGAEIDLDDILWVHREVPLHPNVLVQLPTPIQSRIFSYSSGQDRVNELFRVAIGHRITKVVVATVARQEDYLKRVRSNGGARSDLRAEGIVILGDAPIHAEMARSLEVAVPGRGEFVSLRLARARHSETSPRVDISGALWRLWRPGDPIDAAPIV
jgi:hypothetical protein